MSKIELVRVLGRAGGRKVLMEEIYAEHPENDRSFTQDYSEVVTAIRAKYEDKFNIGYVWRRMKARGWILKRVKPVEVEC